MTTREANKMISSGDTFYMRAGRPIQVIAAKRGKHGDRLQKMNGEWFWGDFSRLTHAPKTEIHVSNGSLRGVDQ
tara:strand:+ start:237 stop:458 length:222 start_codon:yes stop_codon:yes gene_type:complete